MIKLLFSDLDNTLSITDKKTLKSSIPQRNLDACKKLSENGIHLVITTGRFGPGAIKQLDSYNIDYELISSGGSAIWSKDRSGPFKIYPMDSEAVKKMYYDVIKVNRVIRYQVNVNDDHMVLYENNDGHYSEEDICTFEEELNKIEKVHKVVIRGNNQQIFDEVEAYVKPLYSNVFTMVKSMVNNLDITSIDCNKGTAIDELAAMYGCTKEECAGIGDGENDIAIMNHVGVGFAIKKGHPQLCKVADIVVEDFAEAVDKILEINLIK